MLLYKLDDEVRPWTGNIRPVRPWTGNIRLVRPLTGNIGPVDETMRGTVR